MITDEQLTDLCGRIAAQPDMDAAMALLEQQVRASLPGSEVVASLGDGEHDVPGSGAFRICPDTIELPWQGWLRVSPAPPSYVGAHLRVIVAHASLAIDLVRERSLRQAHDAQLRGLVEAGMSLSQDLDIELVLKRIVELACMLVDARYGALGVLDDSGTRLVRFITVGISERERAAIGAEPVGRGLLGVLIRDPRPLRLANLQSHPESVGFPEGHPPMHSFLGVPIRAGEGVRGRLYLSEKRAGSFTKDDERVVMTLAAQAAIALENAWLYGRMTETVADLEAANEQLAEADRHKTAFLAHVSHELRSPLNTILGYARLLREDGDGLSEDQLEDIAIIERSGRHLLGLISDLLDLSRIEAGRLDLRLDDVDVDALAHDVAAETLPQVADGVKLLVEVEQSVAGLRLRADHARLRQMLLNVLGNAAKFTPAGTIVLRARAEQAALELEVSDTGVGIPAADLEQIFESFFQSVAGRGRTPRAHEGAGLGLAITMELARLHGGDVRMSSKEGAGSTVTISLPLAGASTTAQDGNPR